MPGNAESRSISSLVSLVWLLLVAIAAVSCSQPAPPTPVPGVTRTPQPAYTHAPESTGAAVPLLVANFDNCKGTNALGGEMGAAYNPPDNLKESYQSEPERGCVVRLEYKISGWAAFWLKLKGADLVGLRQLQFDVRADAQPGMPGQMKVELKRAGEVSIAYVSGIGPGWKTISVELSDFGPAGYGKPVSAWTEMEELVFTFETNKSGNAGVVYLDNIVFTP